MSGQEGQSRPARLHGFAHLRAAGRYSAGGLARLWGESAFRHEILAAVVALPVYLAAGAGAGALLGFGLLFLLLIAVEALNTAIEEIVDHVSPGWSAAARHAKDLGSLAVACVLAAHGLLLGWVLIT